MRCRRSRPARGPCRSPPPTSGRRRWAARGRGGGGRDPRAGRAFSAGPPRRKQPFAGQLQRGKSGTWHSLLSPVMFGASEQPPCPPARLQSGLAVPGLQGPPAMGCAPAGWWGRLHGPGEIARCYTVCPQLMMWTAFGLVLWEALCDGDKPPQGWSVFLEILKASVRGLNAYSQHLAALLHIGPFPFCWLSKSSLISSLAYCIRLLFQAHYSFLCISLPRIA